MPDNVRITLPLLSSQLTAVLAAVEEVKRDLRLVNEQALDRRVSNLENTVRWLSRTLAGALIAGIVSGIVAVVVAL